MSVQRIQWQPNGHNIQIGYFAELTLVNLLIGRSDYPVI
ncbi:hypothetical protein VIBNISFn118_800015 [Vibrio nigripulchritudo SFn118]|nr:hypothetical protein VIBNISFn118_800015 [Vibrio nigripulchritudo SFn118]